MILKINCMHCGNKEMKVVRGFNYGNENSTLKCEACSFEVEIPYYSMSRLLRKSEYESKISNDVEVIEKNGKWFFYTESKGIDYHNNMIDENWKMIHTMYISDGIRIEYYRNGLSFIKIEVNLPSVSYKLYSYYRNDAYKAFENLHDHFYKTE